MAGSLKAQLREDITSALKAGEKVTVFYSEEGGKDVAHKVQTADSMKKKEKKGEPAK